MIAVDVVLKGYAGCHGLQGKLSKIELKIPNRPVLGYHWSRPHAGRDSYAIRIPAVPESGLTGTITVTCIPDYGGSVSRPQTVHIKSFPATQRLDLL